MGNFGGGRSELLDLVLFFYESRKLQVATNLAVGYIINLKRFEILYLKEL